MQAYRRRTYTRRQAFIVLTDDIHHLRVVLGMEHKLLFLCVQAMGFGIVHAAGNDGVPVAIQKAGLRQV